MIGDLCQTTNYETAVYIQKSVLCLTALTRSNCNDVEITYMVLNEPVKNLHIFGVYRSKTKVKCPKLIEALEYIHTKVLSAAGTPAISLRDFNIDLLNLSADQKSLTSYMVDQGYKQLLMQITTDYHSQLDHIYTNIQGLIQSSGVLESYYSDHKPIFICIKRQI